MAQITSNAVFIKATVINLEVVFFDIIAASMAQVLSQSLLIGYIDNLNWEKL